jgi:4-oxalomesaconate tautomerase
VTTAGDVTPVRIHMVNTGEVALARVATPRGRVSYAGDATIDGVPGSHAAVPLMFQNIAGSMCGALLPTGRAVDAIEGVETTLIDNGMPCVIMRALDLGVSGRESREELDADAALKARIEALRLEAGPLMNLGDVREKSVPKMTLVSAPTAGGTISTRSFIPHRCHAVIGVFAAVSVATACTFPGSPAAELAEPSVDGLPDRAPTGAAEVLIGRDAAGAIIRASTLRTARKLFDGRVFP